MVAAVVGSAIALAIVRGTAEFAAPDDEGVIEHAALFEVVDEASAGLVDIEGLAFNFGGEGVVVVPAAMEELNEADAALGHAAGEEAVAGEGAGFLDFGAVELFVEFFVFAGEVGKLGDGGLHAEGHFLLGDGGLDFGVADFGELFLVELGDEIEHLVAGFATDAFGVGKEENGIAGGLEGDALVLGGEEAGAPKAGVEALDVSFSAGPVGGVENDEVGEVLVHTAEAVGEPGADGGFSGDFATGAKKGLAGIVIDRGGGGGLD